MTTAAARTGPLRQATPTASAPTTMVRPAFQWTRSTRVEGLTTRVERLVTVTRSVYRARPEPMRRGDPAVGAESGIGWRGARGAWPTCQPGRGGSRAVRVGRRRAGPPRSCRYAVRAP